MIAAIVPAVAYLAGWLLFARWYYQLKRPYSEPLSCSGHLGGHSEWCYTRPGSLITTPREAAVIASLLAFVWPLMLTVYGLLRAAIAVLGPAGHPLPEETEAKTERLERDLGMGDKR